MTPTPERTRIAQSWLRSLRAGAGAILVLGGLLAMVAGGGSLLLRQRAADSWAGTEEAAQAARQVDAPTPRWIEATAAPPTSVAAWTATRPPVTATALPTSTTRPAAPADLPPPAPATPPAIAAEEEAEPEAEAEVQPGEESADQPVIAAAAKRAPASAVEIVESEFRFHDPPEPGAQATIRLHVQNRAEPPTGPLRLTLSTRWLSAWRIVDAEPPVLADRVRDGGRRTFDLPGLDGDTEETYQLHLVATDDVVDPPELRLGFAADDRPASDDSEAEGAEIGRARPETVAPRPRPGPARAIAIPRLGLRSAVVQTAWEPPAFVVGQLRETANLSEGNTVLIGHLNGLAGNVFARLDELEPGDEVIATSRGLEYRFVVSETMTLPGDDSIPIQPTDDARLTLMTCIGDWDPIGLDYSHRLWVVAEPPEAAEETLAGRVPGPLTRQLGLAPTLTLLPPPDLGPPPKLAEAPPVVDVKDGPAPQPGAVVLQPTDGAQIGSQVAVRGQLAEGADPTEPLWLAIRAEIEGSRWYVSGAPLAIRRDGTWETSVEVGGAPGIRHTIVVAPVDAATDARLRRHVSQRPGQPLPILPDAFETGARVVVERR